MKTRYCTAARAGFSAVAVALLALYGSANASGLTLLHVGDQESWLLSAQGNLRDSSSQPLSFYGGIDRLATVIGNAATAATAAGSTVLKLNAGDAFLPGPRLNASLANLATSFSDGAQDFYDAIALRQIGFDAAVFGNHEFDLGATTAARFAKVSGTTYLSSNLNFSATADFSSLAAAGTVAPSVLRGSTGIVGLTTPLLPRISSPGPVNLLNFNPLDTELANLVAAVPLVQAQIDSLRAGGAKSIVLISHLQNARNEIDLVVPLLKGVDVVLSGGGHELMADPDDLRLPGDPIALAGHPRRVGTADGRQALLVTSNFGNRYVGALTIDVDASGEVVRDAAGAPVIIDSRMLRVSGAAADADRVDGDLFLKTNVIDPVKAHVDTLNATTIGRSNVELNGVRGIVGAPGSFVAGVRNSETNLGNLAADSLAWAGGAEVALQNGGGIRASVTVGDVTVGNTFDVLPFTNLVKRAPAMTAQQLKVLLEHSYATASPSGAANGRFGQLAGLKVFYDTRRAAGDRVRRVELADGSVLVDQGAVVAGARSFSFATIDFLANGGDGYDFSGVSFENAVNTITYQEALERFIRSGTSESGLAGLIGGPVYAPNSVLDFNGRQVDLAIAVPEPSTYALFGLSLLVLTVLRRRAGR